MTSISNTLNPALSGTTATTKAAGAMDQTDFLRLMTTQLTTQDPFNPVDNTQMVAQMAQFSQVAGIAEMNKSLQTIAAGLTPGRITDAASWIGRSVLVDSDVATPLQDGGYKGEIGLADKVDQLTLNYVDEDGAVVHTEHLGARPAGTVSFGWNGKNEAGDTIATGPLRIVVSGTADGVTVAPPTAAWTKVEGIQSPANGGETKLLTGLGVLSPDDAIRLA